LIYLVYHTLFCLLSQDEQVRCFQNVVAHLTADGACVVEAFVPAYLTRLRSDQYVDAEAIEVDGGIGAEAANGEVTSVIDRALLQDASAMR
jgi:hypothetical protein